jgi:hypothetical protein
MGIDKETIDPHAMRRGLFRVVSVGAHPKLTPLDPHHFACRMRESGKISCLHYNQNQVP